MAMPSRQALDVRPAPYFALIGLPESQHQDSERQKQNCARYDQDENVRAMLGTHYLDQHAAEGSHCDIDQVSNRKPCGLEVNTDHRTELEIDEQEEDVAEARMTLGGHSNEDCGR